MPTTNLQYPLINGCRYDHSSLDIKCASVSILGFKAIDYSDSLEPGEVFGTLAQLLARTRGQYKAEASFEMYRAEYDQIFVPAVMALGAGKGLYEIEFPIDVTLKPEGTLSSVTDNIVGCRIKKPSKSSSAGSDPLAVKVDLSVMYILSNGVAPLTTLKR